MTALKLRPYAVDDNSRRISAPDGNHTLRGFYGEHDDGTRITIAQQFVPASLENPKKLLLVFTAYTHPGAHIVAHVTRAWKGGNYSAAWAELRRQIEASTGTDIGEPLYGGAKQRPTG